MTPLENPEFLTAEASAGPTCLLCALCGLCAMTGAFLWEALSGVLIFEN
jgi:hypothetical protein